MNDSIVNCEHCGQAKNANEAYIYKGAYFCSEYHMKLDVNFRRAEEQADLRFREMEGSDDD